jgi:octaprenyl-diphosphate synthase
MTVEARKAQVIPVEASRYLDLVAGKLEATERVFHRCLASDVPFVAAAGDYIFAGGGKRMRPALVLLTAQLLDRNGDEEVTYAAVVELIHNATLVHDDIIDQATLRRGRPSVNEVWGSSKTVLLGDWLYTTAMQMALSHGNLDVVRRLCTATLRMTEGELLSLESQGRADLSTQEYFRIIDRKTAELFAAAASLPALMEPVEPAHGEALERYGRSLGACFQLVDDLLDFTAHENDLGKPVLSDLKEGKLTLPLILAMERIDAGRRRWVEWVLEDRAFDRASAEQILEIVHGEGTLDEVRELASGLAREATCELELLPPCDARDALEAAPHFVLHRRR